MDRGNSFVRPLGRPFLFLIGRWGKKVPPGAEAARLRKAGQGYSAAKRRVRRRLNQLPQLILCLHAMSIYTIAWCTPYSERLT